METLLSAACTGCEVAGFVTIFDLGVSRVRFWWKKAIQEKYVGIE